MALSICRRDSYTQIRVAIFSNWKPVSVGNTRKFDGRSAYTKESPKYRMRISNGTSDQGLSK